MISSKNGCSKERTKTNPTVEFKDGRLLTADMTNKDRMEVILLVSTLDKTHTDKIWEGCYKRYVRFVWDFELHRNANIKLVK